MKREWVLREVKQDGSARTYVYETAEEAERRPERRTLLDDLLDAAPWYLLAAVVLCGFTLWLNWALGFPE